MQVHIANGLRERQSIARKKAAECHIYRKKLSELKMKKCTVDGETIFSSRSDLIKTLGGGKNGLASPNFRYL